MGWRFNWKREFKQPEREGYKLVIKNSPNVIQGLISFEIKSDHIFMHLIESAPFNIGSKRAMQVWREIWWLMFVKGLFNVDSKEISLFSQKPD